VDFAVIDIVFLGLICIFMIRCFLKGFVSELLSVAGIVLGLLAALFLYKNGAEFLRTYFWHDLNTVPEVTSFVIIFLVVFILAKLLEIMLVDIIDQVSLTNADSFFGILFGLAEGIVVVSLILFILRIQPIFDPSPILSDSIFARFLLPLITGKDSIPLEATIV